MIRIVLSIGILFFVSIPLIFLVKDDPISETGLLFFGDTTVYSNSYTEKKFDGLRLGEAEESIVKKLGDPFESYVLDDERYVLQFSTSKVDSHFRRRIVILLDGKLIETRKVIHID